jgi:hypothetical protein
MALLFMDGFDASDAALKWVSIGTPTFATTTRFGTGKAMNPQASQTPTRAFPASSQVYVGAAVSVASFGAVRDIFTLLGDTATTAHLVLNTSASGGSLELRRGATTLAVSAVGVLPASTWVYLEMSATIADTGGTCVVRVNGVEVINFTGDTKNAGTNSTIDALRLASNTGANVYSYDDLYLCDSTGSTNNTFLGDVRVQTLLPTGVGASTQFTPSVGSNWDNVNDTPYVSTTYNSSATAGQRDTYAMSDLLSGTGTVFGVQDNILALKSDAGAASIKAALKSGATVYYDSTVALGTALGAFAAAVRETDPATSAAWTPTNVNALEFGAEVA